MGVSNEEVFIGETMNKQQDWKEELRKRWHLWNGHIGGGGFVTCHNEVVEFIENLLTLSESRVRGEALKVIEWATGSDTGASSNALCRFMLGIKSDRYSHPLDTSDRGRCIRLLNLIPEWWDRLDEMASIPPTTVNVFGKDGLEIREEGWKDQIPLIRTQSSLTKKEREE